MHHVDSLHLLSLTLKIKGITMKSTAQAQVSFIPATLGAQWS